MTHFANTRTATAAGARPAHSSRRPLLRLVVPALIAVACAQAAHAADTRSAVAGLGGPAGTAPAADAYSDTVRALLQRAGRYPTSREARELRPQGTATVWFELDGSGRLVDTRLTGSSQSALLDVDAVRVVRTMQFPAFGTSEQRRRFEFAIEFAPTGY